MASETRTRARKNFIFWFEIHLLLNAQDRLAKKQLVDYSDKRSLKFFPLRTFGVNSDSPPWTNVRVFHANIIFDFTPKNVKHICRENVDAISLTPSQERAVSRTLITWEFSAETCFMFEEAGKFVPRTLQEFQGIPFWNFSRLRSRYFYEFLWVTSFYEFFTDL